MDSTGGGEHVAGMTGGRGATEVARAKLGDAMLARYLAAPTR
ncbi:hypothetical protein [Tamaricihabitans halophyticus]|nr:hypothetical protein [Tamaricihabitans halophyticus]